MPHIFTRYSTTKCNRIKLNIRSNHQETLYSHHQNHYEKHKPCILLEFYLFIGQLKMQHMKQLNQQLGQHSQATHQVISGQLTNQPQKYDVDISEILTDYIQILTFPKDGHSCEINSTKVFLGYSCTTRTTLELKRFDFSPLFLL